MTTNRFTAAGAGFTNRIITSPDGDIAEDRRTSARGSYNATAPLNPAAAWLIQIGHVPSGGAVDVGDACPVHGAPHEQADEDEPARVPFHLVSGAVGDRAS